MELNISGLEKLKPKEYKRENLTSLPVETGDLQNVMNLVLNSVRGSGGRPCVYANDKQGLEDFRQNSIQYFEYIKEVNKTDSENQLIPDIEGWCVGIGISRRTLATYEKRGGEWSETIDLFKNAIFSAKKQLAFRQKIPTVAWLFDAKNNHGYRDESKLNLSNEIFFDEEKKLAEYQQKSLEERYGSFLDEVVKESEGK